MRAAFSAELVAAAQRDDRVLLLTGDHGYALFDEFRKQCPGQYINAGVAEQNMVGVAAGLAKAGFRPVVYGLSAFVPVRVLEQIKIDVCYENLPVLLIGDGAGLVYSTLGTSHQSFEDIACLRAIPRISILSPCDAPEMTACMRKAFELASPIYLRMGKADTGAVHPTIPHLQSGRLLQVAEGRAPVAFVATGSMVRTAMEIGKVLDVPVWSAPWIKPMEAQSLAPLTARAKAIVAFEEHSVHAGLGSVIAELLAESTPRPVLRIGIADRFSVTCGSYAHAMREHGLDMDAVRLRVVPFIEQWSKD